MLNTRFSPWPSYDAEEIAAVSAVLASNKVNYWTGDICRQFEKKFASWVGSDYAVSLMNGTVALDIALIAMGVGAGDEVVVAPRTFLASASTVVNQGAIPVFADVDRNSQNISAETIARVLTPKTKAIICVHLAGMPCDMDPIMDLAREHGLKVIEDCAQAHGATYKGRSVGSIGDIGAWSFCQDKIMTTGGEGGMVTTNDRALWSAMWSYKDHGKSWEAVYERAHPPGYRWLHDTFGTNWRMLEMQAAIGVLQLEKMNAWSDARARNAAALSAVCQKYPALRVPSVPNDVRHANYRFYAFVEPASLTAGWSRDRIVAEITARGVPCFQGSASEVYLEKAFDGTGWRPKDRLPIARELGETSLAFLVHPTLTADEIAETCAAIEEVMSLASA
ncbi:DegT/DnrJ/EryC1/StrS family aminotransferase [Paradevosia shaoguanensis]|uniref:DegT/DnrJ/EryC1/StrS aminotransferase family protein n=1 Tax=Paradevosia shaoguanensis TaxID=1335043 RepID=A0AA41QRY2_9HYPH|nr:DegT/DnrJ/EryC1/StrS aminotransferase family protein [Paradevosia shaoguanensis]MCF1744058.1 DegT/DnrJ/EryC1/StrS aminotransferase family protein [Paradevosia shaoguanensis]MCI0128541.1 DegT/DnrJ/EryC1/StrS aminotransferase family protein [Paradevosia shaoguanensis]